MGKRKFMLTEDDHRNICELYELLGMIKLVAEETGLPGEIVRRTLREHKVKINHDPNVIDDMPNGLWAVGKTRELLTKIDRAESYEELAQFSKEMSDSSDELELPDEYGVLEEQQCLFCRTYKPLCIENFSVTGRKHWFYKCNRCLIEHRLLVKFRRIHKRHDPCARLHTRVSRGVRDALRKVGKKKNGISILGKLPYSINELKQHLEDQFEPWMSWDNWGKYKPEQWDSDDCSTWTWQIDHITPVSRIWYDSMDHPGFVDCWGLENLRPLSSKENILKSDKLLAE